MSRVVGLIRFSYVSDDPAEYRRTRNRNLRDRARHVLDPARLARRFDLFEAVCLPALAAQPVPDFTAILLVAEALPDAFRDRLDAALAPHPALCAHYAGPASCNEVFAGLVAALPTAGPVRLSFRLDDDDAIPADYTRRALAYCTEAHAGHCLSFCNGWGLGRVRGRVRVWPRWQPFASAGLAHVARAGAARTIYDCGDHQSVAARYPTILDGRDPGFVQTAHGGNDSGSRVPLRLRLAPGSAMGLDAARAHLGAAFPFFGSPALERL